MTKARDLANGATALSAVSATELAYLDGVTSAVQTQIDGKQAVNAAVSTTELGYLDGVTSAIQTQLDAKTAKSTLTTTGDIYYASGANTPARLGIGSTGNVLTVASGIPSWAAPAGGSTFVGVQVTKTANTTISAGGNAQIPWDSEAFDTDGFHDNSTNNARLTVPTGKGGYYTVYFGMQWASSATVQRRIVAVYKNGPSGTGTFINNFETSSINFPSCAMSFTMNLSAGDWIEIDAYQGTASSLDFRSANAIFGMEKIG